MLSQSLHLLADLNALPRLALSLPQLILDLAGLLIDFNQLLSNLLTLSLGNLKLALKSFLLIFCQLEPRVKKPDYPLILLMLHTYILADLSFDALQFHLILFLPGFHHLIPLHRFFGHLFQFLDKPDVFVF